MKSNGRVKNLPYINTLQLIGKKLTELRIEKGYTSQANFAQEHGLPYIQYWRMEKGIANLTFKSLHTVLAIHDLTIEDIFEILTKEQKKKSKKNGQTKALK